MPGGKFFLGIIPARSGSKRIPNKNIKLFNGKPLIAYAIAEAAKSKLLDASIVSTDSAEIAKVSKRFGASVPFLRPKDLALDDSSSADAMRHAVEQFERMQGRKVDCVLLLQPSSPFREAKHIDAAIKKFLRDKANALFSVAREGKPEFGVCIRKGRLEFVGDRGKKRKGALFLNGVIYIFDRETLFGGGAYPIGKKSVLFEMPAKNSIDIDTIEEWERAEKIAKTIQ